MALTLDDLYTSPDHYLHSFDRDAALFVPMDRAAYHRSIFLDGRISAVSNQSMRVPVAMLGTPPAAGTGTGTGTAWIFHIAHCGSTLLARALDDPAGSLVLREPLALRQVAVNPDSGRLAIVAAMIAKRYRADAPTLVKANVPVNFLLPDIVPLDPQARAILLHCGLRDYLLAILRSDNHRAWLRNVTTTLSPHLGDLGGASDARRAATLWLAQMHRFNSALAAMPHARTLDAELFFADPLPVLIAAAAQLDLPLSAHTLADTVAGPLFSTYSKNPDVAFDNDARLARRAELEKALEPELTEAQRWVDQAAAQPPTAAIAARALVSR